MSRTNLVASVDREATESLLSEPDVRRAIVDRELGTRATAESPSTCGHEVPGGAWIVEPAR